MGLALVITFNFNTSVAKGLKLEVRHFGELTPTFVEVTGGKLVGTAFLLPILNILKYWTSFPLITYKAELDKNILSIKGVETNLAMMLISL